MKTTSFRARTFACALLASTGLSVPAFAQANPPPTNHNVDANGVDVVLGTFNLTQTLLSIGPTNSQGLQYTRTRDNDRWVSNFSGGLYQQGSEFYVSIGNTSDKFTYSGGSSLYNSGTFTSVLGDGATLTRSGSSFTYTNSQGVSALLTSDIDTQGRIVSGSGRLSSITHPNGARIGFSYKSQSYCVSNDISGGETCKTEARLQSVISNFQFKLHFGYAQDTLADPSDLEAWRRVASVTAINTAIEACNDPCTPSAQWPKVSFADAFGLQETVTLPDGATWEYNGAGLISSVRAPGSTTNDISLQYDPQGRVSSLTKQSGTWTYSYSGTQSAQTTTVQGPLGTGRVVSSIPSQQIVTAEQDALGRTVSYQYDSQMRPTRITAPEGNYVQFTYDGRGNVTQQRAVAKPGFGLTDIVTSAGFDPTCSNPVKCNQPNSVTDARGNTTDFTYDPVHGGVLTATVPAPTWGGVRPQTRYSYTAINPGIGTVYLLSGISACQTQSSCAGTSDEVKTSIVHSGSNFLPTSISSGSGDGALTATVTRSYDTIGNMVTEDGPLAGTGDTMRYRYNAVRNVIGTISPDPDGAGPLKHRAVRTTYRANGQAEKVENGTVNSQSDGDWAAFNPLEAVETGYDTVNRPVTSRLVSGGTTYALTQTSYDAAGRLECTAQRMNSGAFGSLPTSACTPGAQGSFGPDRIEKNVYNVASEVTQVRTAVGTADEAAEVTSTYTGNSGVQTVTDGENNRTTFEYDGHDRLSRTYYPSAAKGSGTSNFGDYEQSGYDAGSNVTSFRNRAGETIFFSYDNLNRPSFKNLPGAEPDVSFGYDNLGRLISASQPGQSLGFSYDALGRKLSESGPNGTVSSQYDIAGRRTRLTHPDGFMVDHDYLVTGEMRQITRPGGGAFSPPSVLVTFGYDDLGRRTTLSRANGTSTSYGYDPVSRLSQLIQNPAGSTYDQVLQFGYNPASQIVTRTDYTDLYAWTGHGSGTLTTPADGLNQLTGFNASGIGHDAKGNVTNDPTIGYGYGYSSENLLKTVATPWYTGTLTYDPLMRLHDTGAGGRTRFGYDGDDLIGEHGGGVQRARFVHGPGVDEPLVEYSGPGLATRGFLHADERGTIVASSNDAGNVTSVGRYDEQGRIQSFAGYRFGFAGMPYETTSDLYYSRARMYNQRLPRFMQPDPIGYGDGMNMYNRTKGDPVNFTDPWGLSGCRQPYDVCGKRPSGNDAPVVNGAAASMTASRNEAPAQSRVMPDMGVGNQHILVTGTRKRASPPAKVPSSRLPFPRRPNPTWPTAMQPNGCTGVPQLFPASCNAHDVCYATLGVARRVCDREFYYNMLAERPKYRGLALDYYIGVIQLGGPFYRSAQADARAQQQNNRR
jgi:RHS repeat-associated protein